MNKKTKLVKFRKIIILLLFFVVLPLFVLGIVGVTYRVESNRITVKVGNEIMAFSKSDFKEYAKGKSGVYDFNLFELRPVTRYVYYDSAQDANEKFNPIGYGLRIGAKVDVKESAESILDGQKYETKVYAGMTVHFDKNKDINLKNEKDSSKLNTKFEKRDYARDSSTEQSFFSKVRGNLPYRIPFVGWVKKPVMYFLVRVPLKDQPEADKLIAEQQAQGKKPSQSDIEKKLRYQDFKFKITVDENYIPEKDWKHEKF